MFQYLYKYLYNLLYDKFLLIKSVIIKVFFSNNMTFFTNNNSLPPHNGLYPDPLCEGRPSGLLSYFAYWTMPPSATVLSVKYKPRNSC